MNRLSNVRYLHAVRGLAAFLVVVYHAKFILWCGGREYLSNNGLHRITDYVLFSADMLSSCGKQCVVVFFILSAFVIKHSFEKNQPSLREFFFFRSLRIYLPFFMSIVLGIIVLVVCIEVINPGIENVTNREYNIRLKSAYNELSIVQVAKTLVFLKKKEYAGFNFAYWSLLHEAVFYLLFPVYYFFRKALPWVGVAMLILFGLIKSDILYYQLFFIAGLYLYDYFNSVQKPIFKKRLFYGFLILILFVGINILVNTTSEIVADVATFFMTFLIFDLILNSGFRVSGYLLKLGDVSYTLYLNHLTLLLLMYTLLSTITGRFIFYERWPYYIAAGSCVVLVLPIYYLAEKPSLKLIKKLKNRTDNGIY